jgi:hypothetical protein
MVLFWIFLRLAVLLATSSKSSITVPHSTHLDKMKRCSLYRSWWGVLLLLQPVVVLGWMGSPLTCGLSRRRSWTGDWNGPLRCHAPLHPPRHRATAVPFKPLFSSFAADGSEYASGDGDFDPEEEEDDAGEALRSKLEDQDEDMEENMEVPTIELQPPPLSKNAGNRFVAIVWDRVLQVDKSKDVLDLHYDRIRLTEDHVMFCRKQNLYNATFNTESMVDVLWSLPMYVLSLFSIFFSLSIYLSLTGCCFVVLLSST